MRKLEGTVVLVTGGAGFIGSHLVGNLVAAGAHCVVVDNLFLGDPSNLQEAVPEPSSVRFYREDAGDFFAMRSIIDREQPEVIFNLATKALLYSFENPRGAFEVNTSIALTLLELLREGRFQRLVHVSSSEVYGTAVSAPMSENHPFLAETTYAAGKAAADLAVHSYVNMLGVDAITLRPFNAYGPRQNSGALAALIPETIKRITNNQPPQVEGDGTQTRDFSYVEDIVACIATLGMRRELRNETINLGSGSEVSVQDVVQMVSKVMGYEGGISHVDRRAADVDRHWADVTKLDSLLGSRQRTPLEEGIIRTVEWFRRARTVEK